MIRPVDIPSFGWTWTVGDFGFTTTAKNYGEGSASSLSLPLSQLDEHDADGRTTHVASPAELWSMLIGGRRALVSAWWWEQCSDLRGEPLWWGALGSVEGSQTAASIPLDSPMTLLGERYLIRDGKFKDGVTYYSHVAYADNPDGSNDDGSGVSHSRGSHAYLGFYVDTNATPSDKASAYRWSHLKGRGSSKGTASGKDSQGRTLYSHQAWANDVDNNFGVSQGRDSKGKTTYLHTAYATKNDGSSGFSVSDPTDKTYRGTYTDTTRKDSSNYKKYAWKAYSGSTGSIGFSTVVSAGKKYVGTYTDTTESDSGTYTDYSWSTWTDSGATRGYASKTKVNGQTPYLHVATAQSKTGSVNFSHVLWDDQSWIGVYCDFTETDSDDASSYSWYPSSSAAGLGKTSGQGPVGANTNARDSVTVNNLSNRGLACEVIRYATGSKNGGTLPFDLPYVGETGSETATWSAWNVQNLSARTVLTGIANGDGGPDMMFQPYWSDERTVRVRFLAGSDGDAYLPTIGLPQVFRYDGRTGGDIEDLTMTSQVPVQRFYGTGAGSDESTVTALAEDLSSVTSSRDPAVLRESAYSDSDVTSVSLLKRSVTALMKSNRLPCIQLSGTVHVDDVDSSGRVLHPLPRLWPGSMCYLDMSGYRWLPDGRYQLRLMELSGDQSDKVKVTFDVVQLAI